MRRFASLIGVMLITVVMTLVALIKIDEHPAAGYSKTVLIPIVVVVSSIYAFTYARLWLRKQEERRQKTLIAEMNHRVKNIISTVQSIGYQTNQTAMKKCDPDLHPFLTEHYRIFEDRLLALDRAHQLLIRTDWDNVALAELIEQTLKPMADGRFSASGPNIQLSDSIAVSLNLMLHELTTNAVKYGSLSNSSGTVELFWTVLNDTLRITWTEKNGPPVIKPNGEGFGSKLIKKQALREVRGKAVIDFPASGVVCDIRIPISKAVRAIA